jgi:hypothetical protein
MKRKYYIYIPAIAAALSLLPSCTKDFDTVNTDPQIVTKPNLGQLLTHAEYRLVQYQYTEWFYENYTKLMPWSQQVVIGGGNSDKLNEVGPLGDRYKILYLEIAANMDEIRRQIDGMPQAEQQKRKNMGAITYIVEIYHALRVTDMYGSMPYTDALKGRYNGSYQPAFDNQQELFNTWLKELDATLNTLKTDHGVAQLEFGDADFIYKGNWAKWAKCANVLKLRIATRLENADNQKARQIINEVASSSQGIFASESDQFTVAPQPTFYGEGVEFTGSPKGARNFVNLLKQTNDPRLRNFFEKNGFNQTVIEKFAEAGRDLPGILNPIKDPLYRYQGAPVSPDSNTTENKSLYFTLYAVEGNAYNQLSWINRRLFRTDFNGGTGYYMDVLISYAEVCFMMAEFIEKGYLTGDAAAWYTKGVKASIQTYDKIAAAAKVEEYRPVSEAEITDYQQKPEVAYTGTREEKLEKIYIQEYINFFRLPNETFAFVRRTGYPKAGSAILSWEPFTYGGSTFAIPRRFTISDPGDLNRSHWSEAQQEQGFTPNSVEPSVLYTQRLWWDKSNPDFGQGK